MRIYHPERAKRGGEECHWTDKKAGFEEQQVPLVACEYLRVPCNEFREHVFARDYSRRYRCPCICILGSGDRHAY